MVIKKGQKYKTINNYDFHAGTNLIVTEVTGQGVDDFVFWKAETPKKDDRIKGHKRYNKGKSKVWWIKDYCIEVKN